MSDAHPRVRVEVYEMLKRLVAWLTNDTRRRIRQLSASVDELEERFLDVAADAYRRKYR